MIQVVPNLQIAFNIHDDRLHGKPGSLATRRYQAHVLLYFMHSAQPGYPIRMNMNRKLFVTTFLIFLGITNLYAETRFVSDELSINMRADKGNQFRIIKILKSGTPLTVLEVDPAGYTRVRTDKGIEGWVLTRFLKKSPVARDQLEAAQKSLTETLEKNKVISEELSLLKEDRLRLSQSEETLLGRTESMQKEIAKLEKIAARPMQLEAENDKLRNELVKTEAEMKLLKQEYQTLEDNREQEWFLAGAGVLFGGMILGLIFPKLRSGQRKQSWNRL